MIPLSPVLQLGDALVQIGKRKEQEVDQRRDPDDEGDHLVEIAPPRPDIRDRQEAKYAHRHARHDTRIVVSKVCRSGHWSPHLLPSAPRRIIADLAARHKAH